MVANADYTTPEQLLTNSGPELLASPSSVIVSPNEVYAPNPAADVSTAKAPTAPLQPDSVLVARVRQQLNTDASLAPVAAHLHIESQDGNVTLVGNVPDDESKEKIVAQVHALPGVVSVDDQLQTTGSETAAPERAPVVVTSPTTTASVPPAGGAEVLTPTATSNGTNRVYAGTQPQTATAQPRRTFNLHVEEPVGPDGTLAQRIIQEVQRDPALVPGGQPLDLWVAKGKVTLHGTVPNQEEKDRLQAAVQRVNGVSEVDNQLQLRDSNNSK